MGAGHILCVEPQSVSRSRAGEFFVLAVVFAYQNLGPFRRDKLHGLGLALRLWRPFSLRRTHVFLGNQFGFDLLSLPGTFTQREGEKLTFQIGKLLLQRSVRRHIPGPLCISDIF